MFVYCLFCQTQRARKIAELLENYGIHRAFTPEVICRHRVRGKPVDASYDLLPGYVFLFTEEKIADFSAYRRINGVGRQVGRREDQYELAGPDREFALRLYKTGGHISPLLLVHEGEKVKLTHPLFENSRGIVTEIEYKKQRAKVEFSFDDEHWTTWVAVDELRI